MADQSSQGLDRKDRANLAGGLSGFAGGLFAPAVIERYVYGASSTATPMILSLVGAAIFMIGLSLLIKQIYDNHQITKAQQGRALRVGDQENHITTKDLLSEFFVFFAFAFIFSGAIGCVVDAVVNGAFVGCSPPSF